MQKYSEMFSGNNGTGCMKELTHLQEAFQDYLIHSNPSIQQAIVPTEKVSAETRLDIYHFAYRSRLIEALSSNYPMLHAYLGDEEFEKLAHAYLQQYPSTFRSIRWFGNQLPNFMQQHDNALAYLIELAQVEWTMTEIFDAEDADTVSLDVMSHIPPDDWANMRLQMHSSMRLLTLEWNVVPLWQSIAEKKTLDEPVQNQPTTWIFWRNELVNRFCSLPDDEAWSIRFMHAHNEFGELCEGLCQWHDENAAVMRAASFLKGWISAGLIIKVF